MNIVVTVLIRTTGHGLHLKGICCVVRSVQCVLHVETHYSTVLYSSVAPTSACTMESVALGADELPGR